MNNAIHIHGTTCPGVCRMQYVPDIKKLKYLIAMKLTILLATVLCVQASAMTYSQQVTISVSKAPLRNVLQEIRRQSGYQFMFASEYKQSARPVTVNVQGESIEATLERIFNQQPDLEYKLENRTILISVRRPKALPPGTLRQVLQDTIRGTVTDSLGAPLMGVAVRIVGTTRGTITNTQGRFQFNQIPEGASLQFRLLGFADTTIVASANIRLALRARIGELAIADVNVNTGYQNVPKERSTGSFAQPIREMYDGRVSTDVLSRLEGITSAVVFNSPGITGQRAPKISVRGRSTIYANDDPLIVVDNFPYDGDIANINPNDIENVTVLKDAAAASIWGVQAGNGVIVITTKKGRLQQPLKIQFNANATVGDRPDLYYDPNYLDASQFIDLEYHLFREGKFDQDINQNNPNVNTSTYPALSPVVVLLNQVRNGALSQAEADAQINPLRGIDLRDDLGRYFYRRSVNQQYNINLTGGGEKNSYYFSAGFDKNLQNTVGNGYQRITLDGSNTFSPAKNLDVTLGLNYVQSWQESNSTLSQLSTGTYSTLTPYTRLADDQGNPVAVLRAYSEDFAANATSRGFLPWQSFPLEELRNEYVTDRSEINDARISTGLKYTIIKGLSAEAKYQYQRSNTNGRTLYTEESYYARNSINRYATVDGNGQVTRFNWPVGGVLNGTLSTRNSHRFRGYLNFDRQFGTHAITAIAGYEVAEIKTDGNVFRLYGYDNDLATSQIVNNTAFYPLNPGGSSSSTILDGTTASGTLDRFRTYFGNAAWTFRERYTLSASGRIDASNYFGVNTNQKAVPLWSAGAKWDIGKEDFYRLEWLPTLSLRSSYGFQGNLDRSLAAVTTFNYSSSAQWTNARRAVISNYGNPDLRWEKTRMVNVGIDFATAKNIISGSIEYFAKRGIDLIGFTEFAPSTGIQNMQGNYAGTRGEGIDIQITSKNIDRTLKWRTTYLFSWATDRVTQYTGTNITFTGLPGSGQVISPFEGYPVFAIYGLKWAGLDPATGDPLGYDTDGNISSNYTRLTQPVSIEELVYRGNARPVTFGGLYNQISYKQLTFGANLSYKFGYYFRRNGIDYNALINRWVGNAEYADRWQNPGDEVNTNVPSIGYPVITARDNFYNRSDILVERGDHIRLQDIRLSYDLFRSAIPSLPVAHVQVYLYANNIGILWRANGAGLDPDYPRGGIRAPRTWAFGIKASL